MATAALVKVLTILVSNLTTRLASAVLPSLLKARVQVGADDALVQLGASNVLHAVEGVLVGVVLDEAEAAGRLVEPVQPHDEPLDLSALAKELVDLLLGCVERKVADVEGGGILERVGGLDLIRVVHVGVVAVVPIALVSVVVSPALVLR